ncbi:MAG: SCO family protein [Acidimicrobiales bacterium]
MRAAPGFALTDQRGRLVALSQFRGKAVVLDFFDDRCISVCPIVSEELVLASRRLGPLASRVAFVAVNVNAAHESVADVAAFTVDHGLAHLPQWYFLTGSTRALQRTWQAYDVAVQFDPASGAVLHATPMYFIGPHGNERAVAAPTAETRRGGRGYLPAGQVARWAAGIAAEATLLLRGG